MKMISFNCRGLASPGKELALQRLLNFELIDFLFLQETLGQANVITHLLKSWLPRWTFHSLDANGNYGGLALGINSCSIRICNIWGSTGHIRADIYSPELESEIKIINIYRPYHSQEEYWIELLISNIRQQENLIMGGRPKFFHWFCGIMGSQC